MKIVKILLLLFLALPVYAQDDEGDDETQVDASVREKIRAAHAAFITERLALTSSEAEKFWPVYREYREKRKALRQEFRRAKKNGIPEKDLIDLNLKIKQQEVDLEKEYTSRFQKVIPPEKIVKLPEAEADFKKLLVRQIRQRERHQNLHNRPRNRR